MRCSMPSRRCRLRSILRRTESSCSCSAGALSDGFSPSRSAFSRLSAAASSRWTDSSSAFSLSISDAMRERMCASRLDCRPAVAESDEESASELSSEGANWAGSAGVSGLYDAR